MYEDSGLFGFESGYREDLRFMPMAIRYRLDLAGRKLGLAEWRGLPLDSRRHLMGMPAGSEGDIGTFRAALLDLASARGMDPPAELPPLARSAWGAGNGLPEGVAMAASEVAAGADTGAAGSSVGAGIGLLDKLRREWPALRELQRYALAKLARSRREPEDFRRALREFLPGP